MIGGGHQAGGRRQSHRVSPCDLLMLLRLLRRCAGGVIDPEATMDREEAAECRRMHAILEGGQLEGCFRWIVAQVGRQRKRGPVG